MNVETQVLKAKGNLISVLPIKQAEVKTKGGLISMENNRPLLGEVKSVGEKCEGVIVGDIVYYRPAAESDDSRFTSGGETVYSFHEDNILMIVEASN